MGSSYDYPSDEEISQPLLNTAVRRRSSTTKPFNAIRRMGSILSTNHGKQGNKSQESFHT